MSNITELCANTEKAVSRELLLDIYKWLANMYGGITESAWITLPTSKFLFEDLAEEKNLFPNKLLALEKEKVEHGKLIRKIKLKYANQNVFSTPAPSSDLTFFRECTDFGKGYCFIWLDYMGPLCQPYVESLYHLVSKSRAIFNLPWEQGRPGMLTLTFQTRRGKYEYFREAYRAFGYTIDSWRFVPPEWKNHIQLHLLTHYLNDWGKSVGVTFQPIHSNNYKGGKSSPMLITSFAVFPEIVPVYPIFAYEPVN